MGNSVVLLLANQYFEYENCILRAKHLKFC